MFDTARYFAILTVIFSWYFLILPSFLTKANLKKRSLSYMGTKDKVGYFYNFGLFLVPISLGVYLLRVIQEINGGFTLLATAAFIMGTITCISGGLVTLKHSRKLHTLIAQVCFSSYGIGFLLLSLGIMGASPHTAIQQAILAVIGVVGMFYLVIIKNWSGYGQIWGFIFFTFYIGSLYLNNF